MKERKKMTGFVQDTIVPEIVNRKCQEAYDIIYRECRQKNRNITMKICNKEKKLDEEVYRNCEHVEGKINIKKIISMASCAAVLAAGLLIPMTWAGLPTLKDSINNSEPKTTLGNSEQESTLSTSEPENELNIPEPESAFSFINQKSYSKELLYKTDLTSYADPVYKSSDGKNGMAEVTLQSVYCDSFNLAVSLSLTVKDKDLFENTTNLEGCCDVLLNGSSLKEYEYPEQRTIGFIGGGDGNYYATLNYPMLFVEDGAKLEIKISDLYGTNAYKQIGDVNPIDNSVSYHPEKTISISDEYDFVHTIKVDTSHNTIYHVNESYEDVELGEIMVTPFITAVELTLSDPRSIMLVDQNSDQMSCIWADDKWCFSSPYKTSEMLYVEIHRFDMDDFPIEYTFEVPIDEGFAEKNTVDYNNSIIDRSKIVYDPPLDKLDKENQFTLYDKMRSEVTAEPMGVTIPYYYDGEHVLSWTIKNYEVTGGVAGYEINDDWWLERYENIYGSLDGAKLMLVTCEIENFSDNRIEEICITGPVLISKDYYNLPDLFSSFYGHHYSSNKDKYGESLSMYYDFKPHEKKTITFGYVVSQDCIDAGYWACFWDKDGSGYSTFNDVLTGRAKLYEIN